MRTRVVLCVCLALFCPQRSAAESPVDIEALISEGYYARADAAARSLLADLDRRDPSGTLETAHALDLLAKALIGQSAETARVREVLDRSIAIRSRVLGADHPATGLSQALMAEQM